MIQRNAQWLFSQIKYHAKHLLFLTFVCGYVATVAVFAIMAHWREYMSPYKLGDVGPNPDRDSPCKLPYAVSPDYCGSIINGTVSTSLANILSYNNSINTTRNHAILQILQFACGAIFQILLNFSDNISNISNNATYSASFAAPGRGICADAHHSGYAACPDSNDGALHAALTYLTNYLAPNANLVLTCDNSPGFLTYCLLAMVTAVAPYLTIALLQLCGFDLGRRMRDWSPFSGTRNEGDQPLIEVGSNDHYGGTCEQGEGDREEENNTRRTAVAVAGDGSFARPRMPTDPCVVDQELGSTHRR